MTTMGSVTRRRVFGFRWWYRGRTPEGNKLSLSGRVQAKSACEAIKKVEDAMRCAHPDVRWMQNGNVEGEGKWVNARFGPTVQLLRLRKGEEIFSPEV